MAFRPPAPPRPRPSRAKARPEIPAIPIIPWDEFYAGFRWRQAEDVSIIGPKWSGKTNLTLAIMPKREVVAFFCTKMRDPAYTYLLKHGFRRIDEFPKRGYPGDKIMIWPKDMDPERAAQRVPKYRDSLLRIYRMGHWTVVWDEARILSEDYHQRKLMTTYWTQARTEKISIVAGTQRPSWVPLEMYSEPMHFFFFNFRDDDALKRVRNMGGRADKLAIVQAIPTLPVYHALYVNALSGAMAITKPPLLLAA